MTFPYSVVLIQIHTNIKLKNRFYALPLKYSNVYFVLTLQNIFWMTHLFV